MSNRRTYEIDPKGRTSRTFAAEQRRLYTWPDNVRAIEIQHQTRRESETWEAAHTREAITWRATMTDGKRVRSKSLRILAKTLGAKLVEREDLRRYEPVPPVVTAAVASTKPSRPSILDAVRAAGTRSRRWDFTPEQRAEVDETRAAMADGSLYIGAQPFALLLKDRYNLQVGVCTIRARLTEIAGGKW